MRQPIAFKDMIPASLQISDIPIAHQQNMDALLAKVNRVQEAYGGVFKVTSGYRDLSDHKRIYAAKGVSPDKVPMGSKHLSGNAVDIYDPDLHITDWLKNDPVGIACLDKNGLWCEEGNKNWVHFQQLPPRSGKRWFLP